MTEIINGIVEIVTVVSLVVFGIFVIKENTR